MASFTENSFRKIERQRGANGVVAELCCGFEGRQDAELAHLAESR